MTSEPARERPPDAARTSGCAIEALRSELFDRKAIRLIGQNVLDPRSDEDSDPRWRDLRLRNSALHTVLRLLTIKSS
jgi:hypothetical protein